MNEMCVGSLNCKEGVHTDSELLCIPDFLTGKCDCISKHDYDVKVAELKSNITNLEAKLKSSTGEDGFQTKLSTKQKKKISTDISKFKKELNSTVRKIHLTDDGLVPFNTQMEEWNLKEKARIEEENRLKKIEADKEAKRLSQMSLSLIHI